MGGAVTGKVPNFLRCVELKKDAFCNSLGFCTNLDLCTQTWRRILALMPLGVLPAILVKLFFLQVPAARLARGEKPLVQHSRGNRALVRWP